MVYFSKKAILAILLCGCIIGCIIVFLAWSSVYAVTVNGESIVYVKTFQAGRAVRDGYLENKKEIYGKGANYNEDVDIAWLFRTGGLDFSSTMAGRDKLSKVTTINAPAAAIVVDGKDTVMVKDKKIGKKILQNLQDEKGVIAKNAQLISKKFKGDIKIDIKNVDVSEIVSETEAISLLSKEEPLDMVLEYTETVSIPVETKIIEKDSLVAGSDELIYQGKTGEQRNTVRAVVSNADITEKEVISSNVISQPRSAVVIHGTRPIFYDVLAFGGFGASTVPLAGTISAVFGSHGQYWNSAHTGIDIAAPEGSQVCAIGYGTVTAAESNSVYGNIVTINHGNGIETRYAHLSEIQTKVGDVVDIGANIGLCGSTGNVTGSHLHFEVRVNGVFKDPSLYFTLA